MYSAEDVDELIQCPICMDKFENPKILPCQHIFCFACLVKHGSNEPSISPNRTMDCPTCRARHTLPGLGIVGLPSSLLLGNLMDLKLAKERTGPSKCPKCARVKDLSTCGHCNQKLCVDCTSEHRQFMINSINTIMTLMRSHLTGPEVAEALCIDKKRLAQLGATITKEKSEMTEIFDKFITTIEARKNQLNENFDRLDRLRKMALNSVGQPIYQDSLFEDIRQVLESKSVSLQGLRKLQLSCSSDLQWLKLLTDTVSKGSTFKFHYKVPPIDSSSAANLGTILETLGELRVGDEPVGPLLQKYKDRALEEMDFHGGARAKTSTGNNTNKGTESPQLVIQPQQASSNNSNSPPTSVAHGYVPSLGAISVFASPAWSPIRAPSPEPLPAQPGSIPAPVQQRVVPAPAQTRVVPAPAQTRVVPAPAPAQARAARQPAPAPRPRPVPGQHYLNKMNQQWSVKNYLGNRGDTRVYHPYGAVCPPEGPDSHIIAVAGDHERGVMIVEKNGNWTETCDVYFDYDMWTFDGINLDGPSDIAYCPAADNFVIANQSGNQLVCTNSNGRVEYETGGYGSGGGHFENVWGVTIHSGMILAVDRDLARVSVFELDDGRYVRHFGARYLSEPLYVAVGPGRDIYVSDQGDDDVKVFAWNGQYLRSFGKREYAGASGIAVDDEGFTCLARPDMGVVDVYKPDGEFHCMLEGPRTRKLNNPQGLTLLPGRKILVCDTENDRLVII